MPVTKTAKRALRSSERKQAINKALSSRLELAIRKAKKSKSAKTVREALSLTDRAAKKGIIHRNKASRLKAQLSKLAPKPKKASKSSKTSKKS